MTNAATLHAILHGLLRLSRTVEQLEGVFYSPEQLSSGQMERVDMVWDELWPLIEAHTRAAEGGGA